LRTTVVFRVGPFDAEVLETIFAPQFEAVDLVNLGFAQIYLTLMIDGVGSPPFSAVTLPPFDPPPERHVEATLANSRAVYGAPRQKVEQDIKEWTELDAPVAPEPKPRRDYAPVRKSAPIAAPVQAAEQVPASPPVQHAHTANPKELGENLARKHSMAASKAGPSPRRPDRPAGPPKPPLEGATSLRDALLQATGKTAAPAAAPVAHTAPKAHSLKDTLRKIAPAPAEPAKKEGLSNGELESMLKVDVD